jgi:hypothetical protein
VVEEGNQKLIAEEFITTSLFNIRLANTRCHVSRAGNGNEKKRRHYWGIKTYLKKTFLADTNEIFRRLRPWKVLLNFFANPNDIFNH